MFLKTLAMDQRTTLFASTSKINFINFN